MEDPQQLVGLVAKLSYSTHLPTWSPANLQLVIFNASAYVVPGKPPISHIQRICPRGPRQISKKSMFARQFFAWLFVANAAF
jgi:hypothetical protein